MGRAYEQELTELPRSYEWARRVDIAPLARALASAGARPLVAVGSGGSFSAAMLAAFLHERVTGQPARAMTPLEISTTSLDLRGAVVLLMTARGTNTDILDAFSRALAHEPAELIVLTFRANSPLVLRASAFEYVRVPRFDAPVAKDGYLATNSLLAMAVLLARAYSDEQANLPATFEELLPFVEGLDEEAWRRPTIIALHGTATRAAAIDLESKLAEAALANVHVVDFRNFAHGRHLWLDRRGRESLIVAFTSAQDADLAQAMLRLVPRSIPRLHLAIDGEPDVAAVRALATTIVLVGRAGRAHGVDVGRPSVATFGRRMYHLSRRSKRVPSEYTIVERKTRRRWDALERDGTLDKWIKAFKTFQAALLKTTFVGVVFDYDGTLCTAAERFTGCRGEIIEELQRLLDGGVAVGIATGRGKSVRHDLRQKLSPQVWGRVLVGYYNGSDIAPLGDETRPLVGPASQPLQEILRALEATGVLEAATVTVRARQITIEVASDSSLVSLWDAIAHVVLTRPETGVTVVRSTHSIDLLDRGVSKRAVVSAIRELSGMPNGHVLCIGDQGRWPGNDSVLLQEPFSLSVDEASGDQRTCWNLAPLGYRQAQAAVYYLRALYISKRGARIKLRRGPT